MENTTLLKPEEAMRILNVGRSKFYQLSRQPDFPSLKIGRCLYTDSNQLNDWIAQQIKKKQNRTVTETT